MQADFEESHATALCRHDNLWAFDASKTWLGFEHLGAFE